MGQLPVLEYEGKVTHQSIPICRFVAKKVGLTGADDFEDLEIDSVVETINDLRASKLQLINEVKNYIIGNILLKKLQLFIMNQIKNFRKTDGKL